MKTVRAISRILALVAFLSCVPNASAGELGIATMEDGDKVEITHTSVGCFHNETLFYEVRRSAGETIFTQYAITWEKANPTKIAEKKVLGEIKLTKSEVSGLDGLLRFFRGKKEANSTTQDSLLVEYYEGSKRVGTEKLQDESGGYGLEKRKDVVHLYRLAARFKK